MHEGHRQRMLERLENAEQSLQDHEILEILLFNAIPRKNTNEIAHALLLAFGSLEEVLRADVAALKMISGVGSETAAYLRCIGLCFKQKKSVQADFPKTLVPEEMESFLCERYAFLTEEVLEIYCIGARGKITGCKRFTDFLSAETQIDAGSLIALFAAQKPHAIIAAHNHPTATSAPSESDDRFTMQLMLYCSMAGVKLYDHIIAGKDGTYSYYKSRKIEEYRKTCDLKSFFANIPPARQ